LSWIARQAAHRNSKRNFLTAGNSSTDNQAANLYLSIDDTATVTFTLDPQAAERKKARSSWLAAAFKITAADTSLFDETKAKCTEAHVSNKQRGTAMRTCPTPYTFRTPITHLSAHSTRITSGVDRTIGTADCTTQNDLFFVHSIGHAHGDQIQLFFVSTVTCTIYRYTTHENATRRI